jgi:ABC-2 type transporter
LTRVCGARHCQKAGMGLFDLGWRGWHRCLLAGHARVNAIEHALYCPAMQQYRCSCSRRSAHSPSSCGLQHTHACMLTALTCCQSPLRILCRERASGVYGTAAYFITTVGWDFLPMRVAPTALFAAVTYWVMGLRPGFGRVASFFGVLVLVNLAGTAMSMAVGRCPGMPRTSLCHRWGSIAAIHPSHACWAGDWSMWPHCAAGHSCWWQRCKGVAMWQSPVLFQAAPPDSGQLQCAAVTSRAPQHKRGQWIVSGTPPAACLHGAAGQTVRLPC